MSIKYLKDTLDSSPSFKTNEANGKLGLAPNLSSERISVLDSLIKEGVVAHEEILEEVSINPVLQLSLAELFGAEPEELSQEMNLLLFEVSKDAALMKSELLAKSVKESRFDLTKKVINEHAFKELSSDLMEFNSLKVKQSVLMPLLGRFQSTKLEDRNGFIERELSLITNGETKLDVSTYAEGMVERAVTDLKRELEGKKADVSLLVSDIATGSALDRKMSSMTEKYGSSGNEKGFRENVAVALASLAYTDEDFRNKAYGFGFVDSSQNFNAGFTNLSLSDITPKSISIDGLIHKPEQDSSMLIGGIQKEMDELRYLDEQIYKKQLREAELSFLNNGAKQVPHFSLKNKILNVFNERDISLAKEIKLVDMNGRLLMAHSGGGSGSAYTRIPDSQLNNPKVLSFAALKAREAGVNPVYIHPPTSDGVSKAQKAEFVYMATKELLKLGYEPEEIKLGGMLNKKEIKNGMKKAFAEHKAELDARSGSLKSNGENNAFNEKLKSQSDSAKMNTELAAESSSKKILKRMKL